MYRISDKRIGIPAANERILYHLFADNVWVPQNFANTVVLARIAATGITVINIRKNGALIGTATFAAGGTIPVFAGMAAAEEFAPTDRLVWAAPAIPDATLADIAWTVYGERHR